MIEYDKCSPNSCYLKINDFTIYVEVSDATLNVPLVHYWTDEYEKDIVTRMVPVKEDANV